MQKGLDRQESHKAEGQHPHSHLLTGGSRAIHSWILRLKCIYQFLLCVYTLFESGIN